MLSIEGVIVRADGQNRGRIEIDTESGLILKVGAPTGSADIVLSEELIFPGFIDIHVHAREDVGHSQDYKEDFISAGEAGINGGVVAIAEMPNNPIPPVDDASYDAKNALVGKSAITILLYALATPDTKPLSKKVPYKAIIGGTTNTSALCFNTREELEKTMSLYSGQFVSFHCEDSKILADSSTASTHEARRPAQAEDTAIDMALEMIEKYGIHGKICHASTIEGVRKITEAKKRGVDVTVEVTPHHLYFDETMFTDATHTMFQVNPPIRQTKENRLALIEALKDGTIDFLATDHAPHTIEEKKAGISGLTHLDTYAQFTTWLMKEHGFSPQDILRVCSQNPAKFLNNFTPERYGEIQEGYVGSLTILNTNAPNVITKESLKTKPGWSPFEGTEFSGKATMTIVKGKIYEN